MPQIPRENGISPPDNTLKAWDSLGQPGTFQTVQGFPRHTVARKSAGLADQTAAATKEGRAAAPPAWARTSSTSRSTVNPCRCRR